MKTILENGTYKRVSDEVAEKKVINGTAEYAPKSKWKAQERKSTKPTAVLGGESIQYESSVAVAVEAPKKTKKTKA